MARMGFTGAQDRVRLLVKAEPLKRRFARMAKKAPLRAKAAMADAVNWWHGELAPRLPVSAKKHGRGHLRRSTHPVVRASKERVVGGIYSGAPYAIWLLAGTRYIAGGAVMRWKPGDPLITSWPAKEERLGRTRRSRSRGRKGRRRVQARLAGQESQAMPIIIPWFHEARDRFVKALAGEIAKP